MGFSCVTKIPYFAGLGRIAEDFSKFYQKKKSPKGIRATKEGPGCIQIFGVGFKILRRTGVAVFWCTVVGDEDNIWLKLGVHIHSCWCWHTMLVTT